MNNLKITIVGLGYVGIVTTAGFANKGYNITAYDIDTNRINQLNEGVMPIYEPELEEYLIKYIDKITYTAQKEKAFEDVDVIFVCVNTPQKENGEANVEHLYSVIEDICSYCNKDCIVVLKSTIPITTTNSVRKYIDSKNLKVNIKVAFNPEFLAQGNAMNDFLFGSRIVIGSEDKEVISVLKDIYLSFDKSQILVTDSNSAEMIKYASNAFLALKVTYINEIANLCDVVNANIDDVVTGVGLDERIGNKYLRPGLGFGGSCLQKDVNALQSVAKKYGHNLDFVDAINKVNAEQRMKLANKLDKYLEDTKGKNISILGLSYKPNTDDLRDAPSICNIQKLIDKKANIKVWDPAAMNNCKKVFKNIEYCDSIDSAIKDTDACLIFTEWNEIKEYNTKNFEKYMANPIVLDGRNCFKPASFEGTATIYDSIGRGKKHGESCKYNNTSI